MIIMTEPLSCLFDRIQLLKWASVRTSTLQVPWKLVYPSLIEEVALPWLSSQRKENPHGSFYLDSLTILIPEDYFPLHT